MKFSVLAAVAITISAASVAWCQQPSQLAFVPGVGVNYQAAPQNVPAAPVAQLAIAPTTDNPAGLLGSADFAFEATPAAPANPVVTASAESAPAQPPSVPAPPSDGSGNCCGPWEYQCQSGPNWFITTGVEAMFLWTRAADAAGGFPGAGDLAASNFTSIDNQFDVAPRLWLGVENDCGWGLRARYWRFSADDQTNNVVVGPPILFPVTDVTADSTLQAWNVDLELTRRVDRGCWQFLGTAGVRYADLERDEGFSSFSSTTGTFASTDATRSVNGTGLTGSIEARRPINDCGFGFFASARGSVLFGTNTGTGTGVMGITGGTQALEFVDVVQNNPLYIEECEVGVNWLRHLQCIDGWAFASLGFEWQRWDSSETPFNFSQSIGGVHEFGRSISSDVTFTGLGFSVGFTR